MADEFVPDIETPNLESVEAEFTPDEPPKAGGFFSRRKGSKPVKDSPPKRRGRPPALAPRIEEAYRSMGALAGMGGALSHKPGITYVGNALVEIAPDAARAWQEAAKQYPALADAWEKILGTSVAAQLLLAHMPLFLAVYAAANGSVPAVDNSSAPQSLEDLFSNG